MEHDYVIETFLGCKKGGMSFTKRLKRWWLMWTSLGIDGERVWREKRNETRGSGIHAIHHIVSMLGLKKEEEKEE